MSKATRERMRLVKGSLEAQPRRSCTLTLTDLGDGGFEVRGVFGKAHHPRFEPTSPAHCAMKVLLDLYVPTLGERVEAPAPAVVVDEDAIKAEVLRHLGIPTLAGIDPASVGEDRSVVQLLDAHGSPLTH